MTGVLGAAAVGAVWGWLVGGRLEPGAVRPASTGALLGATIAAAAESVALADGAAAAFFVATAAATLGLNLVWRASLVARVAAPKPGGPR
jgi:hypothetical protein